MTHSLDGPARSKSGLRCLVRAVLVPLVMGLVLLNANAAVSGGTEDETKKPKPAAKTALEDSDASPELSYFTLIWELDKEARGKRHAIVPYNANYGLVMTYNTSPNFAPWLEVNPEKTLTKTEVTFQLSFKTKLWEDVFGQPIDLWFGYTQRSFWQLYNFDDSSPFRETNYEPELLINYRTRFSFLGINLRFITLVLNHQSNGQTEPLSRSWNRIMLNFGLERGRVSALLKTWLRFPEPDEDNDNPEVTKYLGHGELWLYYFVKRHRFAVMVRDNLNFNENRGAIQVEWSFPLFAQVAGYVQGYFGYGESLLDHDHKVTRIGFGFILTDWN